MVDILTRITELREERHWTEYQLSERSGLTQSTISSWYRKQIVPSVPSLSKICDAFGITLSQFFLEENANNVLLLNDIQLQLIKEAAKLNSDQYNSLLNFLKTI